MAAKKGLKVPPVVVQDGQVILTIGPPSDDCPVCQAIARGEDPLKVMREQEAERTRRVQAG
jgi:hypothetical protein